MRLLISIVAAVLTCLALALWQLYPPKPKLGIVPSASSLSVTVPDTLVVGRYDRTPLRVGRIQGGVSVIRIDAGAGVDSIFIGDRLIYDATDSLRAFRIFGREYRVRPGFYVVTDSAVYSGGGLDSTFLPFLRGAESRGNRIAYDPAFMLLERVK